MFGRQKELVPAWQTAQLVQKEVERRSDLVASLGPS